MITGIAPSRSSFDAAKPRRVGVLIVDDALELRQMLSRDLQQQGFTVWQASTGEQAIELFRQRSQEINTVLMDVCMPDLDGPQTLAVLRQVDARIRCCFMTFSCDKYTEEQLVKMGAYCVLQKPYQLSQAAHVLRELARNP